MCEISMQYTFEVSTESIVAFIFIQAISHCGYLQNWDYIRQFEGLKEADPVWRILFEIPSLKVPVWRIEEPRSPVKREGSSG